MSVKKFRGKIVSAKMQKTVVVAIEVHTKHAIYSKRVANTKRIKARNEIGALLGDEVMIEECRPISKEVNFRVVGKIKEKK